MDVTVRAGGGQVLDEVGRSTCYAVPLRDLTAEHRVSKLADGDTRPTPQPQQLPKPPMERQKEQMSYILSIGYCPKILGLHK